MNFGHFLKDLPNVFMPLQHKYVTKARLNLFRKRNSQISGRHSVQMQAAMKEQAFRNKRL